MGATECEKDACGMEDDELEWKGVGEDDCLGEEEGFGEEGCEERGGFGGGRGIFWGGRGRR